MAPTTLRVHQDDPNVQENFGILINHIQPSSTASASQSVTSFTQSVKKPDEDYLWKFWEGVFDVVQQIPHSDPAQDKLVAFLRELTLTPETGDRIWEEARIWTDLPLLGPSIRHSLDRDILVAEQVSFHALVARLLHAGISPGSELTALWMLRDALEKDGDDIDRALKIAAVYIEYAGATLVQTLKLQPEPQLDETEQRMTKGGELWKGKSGLTADRWKFWGKRFREQAEKATEQEAQESALHAARLIEVWTETRLSE
ncbi:hypothetical protein F4808DRAFT_458772 [Astrocystis sublimbata]|nr:hypothetical protein F4808DRAFT_458772 [Astrocystis sublimbata]